MKIGYRQILKRLLPPIFWQWREAWRRMWRGEKPEWEYVGKTWPAAADAADGWDDPSVVAAQSAKWPIFVSLLPGNGPLGIAYEAATPNCLDMTAHNLVMTWAYVLARASHGRRSITLLDWGGGLGHYLLLSRALMPEVEIKYFCRDLPRLCRAGQELHPQATFYENDDAALRHTYDLILVSGSLQYKRDWQALLQRLAKATGDYLFITRLPVVENMPGFVIKQRPHAYGYKTEYIGWVCCREEFLRCAADCGLSLVREVLCEEGPFLPEAPGQPVYRGYLFATSPG